MMSYDSDFKTKTHVFVYRMICSHQIHDDLKQMEESVCPFCDQLLVEGDKAADLCCAEPDIDNNNGMNVCLNCGLVHYYDIVNEFIDFHENMHKIHRKSVYQRKYHIETILNGLLVNQRVELTHNQRDRIYNVFVEIGNILGEVNGPRKRIISVKYLLQRICDMMDIKYNIHVTKSIRTLNFYNAYWEKIMTLIGDKIESILLYKDC